MNYITLFNKKYLPKGIALYDSIKKFNFSSFNVLCLDEYTFDYLGKYYPEIRLFTEKDIQEFIDIECLKKDRTLIEYFWSLSSVFSYFYLSRFCEDVTYLDSDIYFFSDPNFIFHNNKNDIFITKHNFSSDFDYLLPYGKYNVQFVTFKYTKNALKVSRWWMDSCISWCYNRLDISNGRFGDQKYLESFNKISDIDVFVVPEVGFGVAPWNFKNYDFNMNNNKISVNNETLYFYHFHQFHIFNNSTFLKLPKKYLVNSRLPNYVYEIYTNKITTILKEIKSYDKNFIKIFDNRYKFLFINYAKNILSFRIKRTLYSFISFFKT